MRPAIGGAVCVAALLAPVGAAQAGVPGQISAGGLRYVTTLTQIDENSQEGLDAVCPGDEPVVGGGVSTNASLGARVEINTSRPFDADGDGRTDDGWRGYMDNLNSDGAFAAMAVMAICDKRAAEGDYRYVTSQSVPSLENSQTPVNAECPKREPVVSGGVVSSGFLNDEMHLNTTQPFDGPDPGSKREDGWQSWVDNEFVGTSGQVIAGYAVCDRRRSAAAYEYRMGSAESPDNDEALALRRCRSGERIVGGGLVAGTYPERMYGTVTFGRHANSGTQLAVPDRWAAGLNNLAGGSADRLVQVYAVCRA